MKTEKTSLGNLRLKQIEDYAKAYRLYLRNNELDDDSNGMTIEDLFDFVNNEISDDDLEWYGLPYKIELV